MKDFFIRVKLFLTTDSGMDSLIKAHDRITALEAYVKDLKWVCESLGYNPETHGFPPKEPKP
jgi:hypothetical protein